MRSKQSAALVSAPAAAAADCLEQHVHNTISVDLSHVLELLRPSTLRYPSFDFTPIQSKLGVLWRNYSERARERYAHILTNCET